MHSLQRHWQPGGSRGGAGSGAAGAGRGLARLAVAGWRLSGPGATLVLAGRLGAVRLAGRSRRGGPRRPDGPLV